MKQIISQLTLRYGAKLLFVLGLAMVFGCTDRFLENVSLEKAKVTDIPATITSVSPAEKAINVQTHLQRIEIKFSESVELNTVINALSCDNGLNLGTVTWDFQNNTLVYPVNSPLNSTPTTYTCTLGSVLDYGRNPSNIFTWSFTSIDANAPSVLSTTPGNNATGVDRLTNSINIIFSKPMDIASLNNKLSFTDASIIIGTPTWNALTNTATYPIANAPLPNPGFTTFTARLQGTVRDSSPGQNVLLSGDYQWTFTTGGPSIANLSPQNNRANLTINPGSTETITITFSESMNPTPDRFSVNNGMTISSVTATGNQVFLALTGSWQANASYTVVGANIQAATGTTTKDTWVYNFSTARMLPLPDGRVFDGILNIYWHRCHQGQTWDGSTQTCLGTIDVGNITLGGYQFCSNDSHECNQGVATLPLAPPFLNGATSEAYETCQILNAGSGFAGSKNWRIPTFNELASLDELMLDTNIFPNLPSPYGPWPSRTMGSLPMSFSGYEDRMRPLYCAPYFFGSPPQKCFMQTDSGNPRKSERILVKCVSD